MQGKIASDTFLEPLRCWTLGYPLQHSWKIPFSLKNSFPLRVAGHITVRCELRASWKVCFRPGLGGPLASGCGWCELTLSSFRLRRVCRGSLRAAVHRQLWPRAVYVLPGIPLRPGEAPEAREAVLPGCVGMRVTSQLPGRAFSWWSCWTVFVSGEPRGYVDPSYYILVLVWMDLGWYLHPGTCMDGLGVVLTS